MEIKGFALNLAKILISIETNQYTENHLNLKSLNLRDLEVRELATNEY